MKSRKQRERELHKKLAIEYDEKREGARNGRYYSKFWLRFLIRFLPKKQRSILDVGCGTGLLYEVIKDEKLPHKYTGTDFSPDMVNVGKSRYKGIKLYVDDAEKMRFKDSSFDAVVMRSVLHHIPHPEKAVAEMARVCKDGGYVIISEPHRTFITAVPRWLTKKLTDHFDEDHTHYSRKEFSKILAAGGITDFKLVHFGYTAYPFGFPDIFPPLRHLPLPVLKALVALDSGIAKIPLLNRLSWHLIVVAKIRKK